jgi:hypothetical protein
MKNLKLNNNPELGGKYGFDTNEMFVVNPIVSDCGRFAENPEKHGFEIWHTGSGCTGHGQLFLLDGKQVLMLLTDGNLCHISNDTIEATVGIFDPDMEECSDHWTISR